MSVFNKILRIFVGIVIVSISARITIDVPVGEGIPISAQSLAVLLVGWYLGPRDGFIALVGYVLSGAMGMPVFADGAFGWSVLGKGSGGFLLGFIPAASLSGYYSQLKTNKINNAFYAMVFGTGLIIACGLLRLTQLYGWEKALAYGFYPFWPGAVIKIVLGVLIIWAIDTLKYKQP